MTSSNTTTATQSPSSGTKPPTRFSIPSPDFASELMTQDTRIEAMFIRLIVGTAAVAGVTVCGLLSTRISYKMADQVNGKLPKEAQFSLIGWYLPKNLRLYREYRGLFPNGHLLLQVLLRLGFNGWLRDNCCVGNRFFRKMRLRRKFSGLRRLL